MKKYIVSTHVGEMETMAYSEGKAIANVRWRVFGGRIGSTKYWTVRAA